jgi:hypothetical protein
MVRRSRTHSLIHCTSLVVFFCFVTVIILIVRHESVLSVSNVRKSKTWKYHHLGTFCHVSFVNMSQS